MLLEKCLAFVPTSQVGYGHPKKLEIRGKKMLNCERSTGPFPQVACFDFLFSFPRNFRFQPWLKVVM